MLGWAGIDPSVGFFLASFVALALVIGLEASVFRRAGADWNDRLVRRSLIAFLSAVVALGLLLPLVGADGSAVVVVVLAVVLVLGPLLAVLATRTARGNGRSTPPPAG